MQVTRASAGGARWARGLFGLCLLAASACGSASSKTEPAKHTLEGSLGQVMNLGWDLARIDVSLTDVSVRFVRQVKLEAVDTDGGSTDSPTGYSEDYPLIVTYRLDPNEDPPGKTTVDLTSSNAQGPKGVATRNVQKDPRTSLPKIVRGELTFDRTLDPGAVVSTSFHITFENGIEAASGRTVFANSFAAKVTE